MRAESSGDDQAPPVSTPLTALIPGAPPAWIDAPPVLRLLSLLGEARIVGGAVRDLILAGRAHADIDMATPLVPEAVLRRLKEAGIRAIPTGLQHGTVTALLMPPSPVPQVEITTLRRDISTDGRHADVAFTTDWQEDAARRDFTINALSLDRAGQVWDYFGGIDDCHARRVRFIGDPKRRIEEDYLRILRFYRFQAWFGNDEADAAARQACSTLAGSLNRLSAERIRSELLKLLPAPGVIPVLHMMREDGIWPALFPSIPPALNELEQLLTLFPEAEPIQRLAVLAGHVSAATAMARRLKLPNTEAKRLAAAFPAADKIDPSVPFPEQRRFLYRLGPTAYLDGLLLHAARNRAPSLPLLLELIRNWVPPRFELSGGDLLAAGIPPGPTMGMLLRRVEDWWVDHDFGPDREACLTYALRLNSGT